MKWSNQEVTEDLPQTGFQPPLQTLDLTSFALKLELRPDSKPRHATSPAAFSRMERLHHHFSVLKVDVPRGTWVVKRPTAK
jgi:hypothetical protein